MSVEGRLVALIIGSASEMREITLTRPIEILIHLFCDLVSIKRNSSGFKWFANFCALMFTLIRKIFSSIWRSVFEVHPGAYIISVKLSDFSCGGSRLEVVKEREKQYTRTCKHMWRYVNAFFRGGNLQRHIKNYFIADYAKLRIRHWYLNAPLGRIA